MKSPAIKAKEQAVKAKKAAETARIKNNQALIRKYRGMGWSTYAIAIKLGVTEVTVRNYECRDPYSRRPKRLVCPMPFSR